MRARTRQSGPSRRFRSGPAAALAAGTTAACTARAAYAALSRRPPGGETRWTRTNHRGEPDTLLEGPARAVASVVGSAVGPGLAPRARAALAAAGTGAAAFGGYDDLAGSGSRRGFRGHLGALVHGEVTTGAVKLGGIGATGLASAMLLGGGPADVAVNAGLVAGGANLLNLFDLRPGRALKVALASGTLLAAGARGGPSRAGALPAVAAPLGAAAALLPEDLGERAMLGDAGANALGALLGVAAAAEHVEPPQGGGALNDGGEADCFAGRGQAGDRGQQGEPRRAGQAGRRGHPEQCPECVGARVTEHRPFTEVLGEQGGGGAERRGHRREGPRAGRTAARARG